jgi:hypothetical protein
MVRQLPPKERLRLAALILQEIVTVSIEEGDAWSEEDLQDLARASLHYATQIKI